MDRRNFLKVAGGSLLVSHLCRAQSRDRVVRIGRLGPISAAADTRFLEGLRQGLKDLGWTDGRNIAFEYRYSEGRLDRLPVLAAELVRSNVDIIVTGSNQAALAAKNATRTTPIVMVTTGDPLADDLIDSFAQPGANVTGITALGQELNAKRLELLKAAVPDLVRVAVLANPDSSYSETLLRDSAKAVQALGLQIDVLKCRSTEEIDTVFTALQGLGAGGVMVPPDTLFITHRSQIVRQVAKLRIPAMYGERVFMSAGGMMFYGASLTDMYRRAATFIDKILRGARPADLPVEQAAKFELVVNLRAAKELGIVIPQSILLRADEVIE